jgi:hypothetical protein
MTAPIAPRLDEYSAIAMAHDTLSAADAHTALQPTSVVRHGCPLTANGKRHVTRLPARPRLRSGALELPLPGYVGGPGAEARGGARPGTVYPDTDRRSRPFALALGPVDPRRTAVPARSRLPSHARAGHAPRASRDGRSALAGPPHGVSRSGECGSARAPAPCDDAGVESHGTRTQPSYVGRFTVRAAGGRKRPSPTRADPGTYRAHSF